MDRCEQPVTGAAQRRKQRRLRSWWRHEQQSIAAALATSLTPHEDRGRPGPGRRRARRSTRPSSGGLLLPRRSSSCTTRKMPSGRCGLGRSVTLCRRAGWCGTAAVVKQIVDIPVPQGRRGVGEGGGLQGLRPGQNSTADVEQIVDLPASGSLQGLLPGQGSSSSSRLLDGTEEGIHGVFRTFPQGRKVRRYSASRVRECPPVPAHPSWALIKWLRPGSLMRVGRMRLAMPCPLIMRLYGGCGGWRGAGLRRGRWCSCTEVRGSPGYGRSCALQRQVPAVHGV